MVGAIIGGLSAVASGISALQNFQRAKTAEKSAKMYTDQLMGLTEQNKLKGLSVPDLASLGYDRTAQAQAASIGALQGMGAEGAAQVANLNKAATEEQAQITQDQAQLMYDRDAAVAAQDAAIEQRKIDRQDYILSSQALGAQTAAADARTAAGANISSMFSGLGSAAENIFGKESFDDWQNKRKAKLKEREANQNTLS
jgi:hypothetical protein